MKSVPTRALREKPDLDQLRRQAKELLASFLAGEPDAVAEVNAHYHGAGAANFALHDAQLVLARAYGFESWPRLKAYVDGVTVRRLADAVRAGDVAAVESLLDARPELVNFDMAENDEHRAIHHAVLARSPQMTRLLMRRGADARAGIWPHREATSALTLARERGFADLAAIIEEEESRRKAQPRPRFAEHRQSEAEAAVERGDDAWLRAKHAEGALQPGLLTAAVKHNRPEMLALLLDLGFDPNERERIENIEEIVWSGGRPLWTAAAAGKHAMAETLLQHGADPNLHVYAAGSSVHSAYSRRDREMVELLQRYGGKVTPDTVALYRETELARKMIAGASARDLEDFLRFGAMGGDPEIVRMALERIDWTRGDQRWFWTLSEPLFLWNHVPWLRAAHPELDRGTYHECFRRILERCDPNLRQARNGQTMLHEAATCRDHVTADEQVAFGRMLLDAGARTDTRDNILRSTPLGWACRWGRLEFVRLLLDRGADPAEPDAEPWATPVAWAQKLNHTRILEILR